MKEKKHFKKSGNDNKIKTYWRFFLGYTTEFSLERIQTKRDQSTKFKFLIKI